MPLNAIRHVEIDHCLPVIKIAGLLTELASMPVKGARYSPPEKIAIESEAAMLESGIDDMNRIGAPTIFTCPACKGSLWSLKEGNIDRYRCHVGHSYLPESLVADQSDQISTALYTALAAMEEKAAMLRRLASQVAEALPSESARYQDLARKEDEQAAVLKRLIRDDLVKNGRKRT
jgi:two-component system chemotaxis response regulator CheB